MRALWSWTSLRLWEYCDPPVRQALLDLLWCFEGSVSAVLVERSGFAYCQPCCALKFVRCFGAPVADLFSFSSVSKQSTHSSEVSSATQHEALFCPGQL